MKDKHPNHWSVGESVAVFTHKTTYQYYQCQPTPLLPSKLKCRIPFGYPIAKVFSFSSGKALVSQAPHEASESYTERGISQVLEVGVADALGTTWNNPMKGVGGKGHRLPP